MKINKSPFPECFNNLHELDDFISTPDRELISFMERLEGDIMILGVGGKMGGHVALLARRAFDACSRAGTVYGVSRFSDHSIKENLEKKGIRTISCDLLRKEEVSSLPLVKNIIFMAGKKFGTSLEQGTTWAMNTVVPANVADHFRSSRIVVFSTGCVYDFTSVGSGGSQEEDDLSPIGDYANSAVGRERIFEFYSAKHKTDICMFRLNYSVEMRYGVLREIGLKVKKGETIDLTMGHVNVIWQGDAVRLAILCLGICSHPAEKLNVTGPETIALRYIADKFGEYFSTKPLFTNEPSETALLSNAGKSASLFGYPRTSLLTMIKWTARWIESGGDSLEKPTHFETRNGRY